MTSNVCPFLQGERSTSSAGVEIDGVAICIGTKCRLWDLDENMCSFEAIPYLLEGIQEKLGEVATGVVKLQ